MVRRNGSNLDHCGFLWGTALATWSFLGLYSFTFLSSVHMHPVLYTDPVYQYCILVLEKHLLPQFFNWSVHMHPVLYTSPVYQS